MSSTEHTGPCSVDVPCDACREDLALLGGDLLPAGWTIEPDRAQHLAGLGLGEVLCYAGQRVIHISSRESYAGDGAIFWSVGGYGSYSTRAEAVRAALAAWQPIIADNLAAGREPLWRPAAIFGTGAEAAGRDKWRRW